MAANPLRLIIQFAAGAVLPPANQFQWPQAYKSKKQTQLSAGFITLATLLAQPPPPLAFSLQQLAAVAAAAASAQSKHEHLTPMLHLSSALLLGRALGAVVAAQTSD